jgi:hypothetical protein
MAGGVWFFLASRRPSDASDVRGRLLHQCATLMLAVLGVHSLLEYPLWYVDMLLPAAYLLGLRWRYAQARVGVHSSSSARFKAQHLLQFAGVLTVLGTLYAIWDYSRVLQIYSPYAGGMFRSLESRIEVGRRSALYGYLADYAAVTTPEEVRPAYRTMETFRRPLHHLVNVHLLIEYARRLQDDGQVEKAHYIVARVKEFDTPLTREFFAPCVSLSSTRPIPFQCSASSSPTVSFQSFD